ncbi:uncharacterized protein LOC105233785 isoform X1 [Bactrocera dorsalis]|uniref:Uncharacterized protein LOC105233785 isoform X1 n=1 Tax=Bactrocera dorsalis TaxID=27457 RepID=A0ABM3J1H4_BACDO|nr:uncharacterized protein LOC105233785 isoform X1 [Bactrocera dorsalis]XP_049303082.1 uncharacterized protein LOC105233785 isoform X1 [Bactrocera dorsalis]XP_049303083.1 uncharacterized protein LOC105233785 isoform X1 [Bactrocera dorsalis]
MSRARELALLEKWTDAAAATATNTFPPLASPTSPKATKFCCCPNRRRYNLKQPKAKSTLDARNIFLDNDFTYIDDVDRQGDSNNHISIKGNSGRSCSSVRRCEAQNGNTDNCTDSVALVNLKELDGHQRETDKWLQLQQQSREGSTATIVGNNFADDYDDICDVVDNAGNRRLRLMNAAPQLPTIQQKQQQHKRVELATQCHKADHLQQMRHDKSFHNNSSGNTSANDKSTSNNNNICDCENDKSDGNNGSNALIADNCQPKVVGGSSTTTAITTTGEVVGNNCAGACKSDKGVVCEQQQKQQLANDGLADDHKNDQQKIQRLSDSELKHSNINCKEQQTQQKQHCVSVNITGDSRDFSELQARVNCQLDSSTTTTAPDSNRSTAQQKQSQNNSINYNNDKANSSESDSKIDLQNKMTITTTNAASRKHSRVECGLRSTATTPVTNASTATTKDSVATDNASTATTTEIAPCSVRTATNMTSNTATTDMPTSACASATNTAITTLAEVAAMHFRNTAASPTPSSRPSTPSLTTVIKTTLVKRTPSTESSKTPSPVTTPTTITKSIVTATVSARAYNSVGNARAGGEVVQDNAQETTMAARPRTSVKQRIAAFAAGNEKQTRNHDNSIKIQQQQAQNHNQIQSNGKQNMTRKSEVQPSTTNGESSNTSAHVMGGTEIATATENATSRAAATPQSTSVSADHTAVASTPVTRSAGSSLARSTGYATMPRRSVNNSCAGGGNNAKCGSGCAVNHNGKAAMSADNTSSDATADNCCKLAATLDNLDLAVVRDLTDDDGEDSYTAFQEYLERVEHEINEVFEERRARQREQQMPQCNQSETSPNDVVVINNYHSNDNGLSQCDVVDAASEATNTNTAEIASQHATSVDVDSQLSMASTTSFTPRLRTTTELKALPPPPLGPPNRSSENNQDEDNSGSSAAGSNEDYSTIVSTQEDVNIWANKFLRDLDNLMSSTRPLSLSACSSPTSKTSPQLLSAAATAAIQSRYGRCAAERAENWVPNGLVLLRPEKHTTIPLQSFNLDCARLDNGINADNNTPCTPAKPSIAYMRTLSAPTEYHQQQPAVHNGGAGNRNSLATFNATTEQHHQHYHNLTNLQCGNDAKATSAPTETNPSITATILKIEETTPAAATALATTNGHRRPAMAMTTLNGCDAAAAQENDEESLKSRRQRQLENDMETMLGNNIATTHWTQRESSSQSQSHHPLAQQLCNGDKGGNSGFNSSGSLAAMLAIPKRERINHATMTTPTSAIATAKLGNTVLLPSTLLTSSASKSNGGGTTSSLLLNGGDVTKKGSTSTIWTSEESILRSVGAVDEDNNSTSSSACEEASGVLSSGKSGISLDSSGLDNDNNESGIGTATPPKEICYWKTQQNDNESISSLDALRKMKFQKSGSVVSSDDPDLLEVLSLCDEPHGDEDITINGGDESHDDIDDQQHKTPTATTAADKLKHKVQHLQQLQHHRHRQHQRTRQDDNENIESNNTLETAQAIDDGGMGLSDVTYEYDEGHDDFEIGPYCNCECNDGDASSASGSGGGGSRNGSTSANETASGNSVVLRRKLSAGTTPIMMPYGGRGGGGGRAQKCRSHSLDTSSLPAVYYQYSPLQHQHPQQHHPLTRKIHQHLHGRGRERGQLSLALRQEPFQSLLSPTLFAELPSPSSASLHSGHESLGIQELTTKSNSAPLLLKKEKTRRDDFSGQKLTLRYSRSQSDRYLAEIEAVEACKWLRAAGFPQYAQMYEDHQFPLDLTNVAKDHTNLENDQLQSLYRRLCILNRCANMRLDQAHKAQTPQVCQLPLSKLPLKVQQIINSITYDSSQQKEDSDDENCALSENWTFQPHIRRWSRIGEMGLELPPAGKLNIEKTESSSKESSPDRFEDDSYDMPGGGGLSLTLPGNSTDSILNESTDSAAVRLRRTGSERFKDGAKAFLRRVESIKSRRRKRQNREGIVISGPQALDLSQLGQRSSIRKPDAVYSTPPSPSAVSPMHTFPKGPMFGNELKVPSQSETFLSPNRASPKRTPTTPRSMRASPLHFFSNPMPHLKEGKSDDSSSYYSDSQESSAGGKLSLRKTPSKTRRFLQRTGKVDDIGAHSDSECHHGRKLLIKDANSNTTEIKVKKLTRGGSLNLGKDPKKREGFRSASFRSRSTSRKETKPEETENIKRTPVVRWHSFQMEERPNMIFRKCFSQKIDPNMNNHGIPFVAMSAGQLHILRKLALVILTGYMERYCPTHRSGWNWELPKFIKKIKMPDYKDKKVFGVPLLLILQRTGQTLPIAIRAAFRWLQVRALDQIGLFRKSGVKSRIIKLKSEVEQLDSTALCMEVYDTQQAYDVADMLKQYFRDLPESLLTTKMSETFAAIFQHLPKDVRLEAVQCAVLLLPDENREILYALLEFLTLVAANAEQNQMTANNLAVCLAPSLFHSTISTGVASVSASPRRRKGAGVPDDKELQEAKASHECLSFMIENYKQIFTASKEKISKCNFGYMEESKPVPLEALGEGMQFHNWRGYLYECTKATIKEGREKTRGWFTISSQNDSNVDIAYKKVGDGHPLRLWRCTTEVEGPPKEVLDYIIKQRASWDSNLLESQTVKKLDATTEIFQYAIDGQFTTDFCVLRSWQTTDLPRGACVIVETSIDHAKAKPMFGAIRGVVLASRYLIEPCGSGRSRVMHLTRVDVKGRTPEWYNKSYGHICSLYLSKIRLAFKHVADGPESKV